MHDRIREALLTGAPDVRARAATAAETRHGAESVRPAPAPSVARFERRAMGSPLRLTVVGIPGPRASAAWEAVSAAFEELEQTLSRFRPTSDLVTLEPAGRQIPGASRSTPACTRPWRSRSEPGAEPQAPSTRASSAISSGSATRAPSPSGLTAAGRAPAERRVAFSDGRWLRRGPRQRALAIAAPIDLGGIGKGLALRWGFEVLLAALPEITRDTGPASDAGGCGQR